MKSNFSFYSFTYLLRARCVEFFGGYRYVKSIFVCSLLFCCVLFVSGGKSYGAVDLQTSIEAPIGFSNLGTQDEQLGVSKSIGVKAIRILLYWNSAAPAASSSRKPDFDASNPDDGYRWEEFDKAMSAFKKNGFSVMVTITGPGPRWATAAKRDGVTNLDPKEFKLFVTAVAKRYGTSIDVFSIWNEPNIPTFLRPQYAGGRTVAPTLYRSLVQAAIEGVQAAGYGGKPIVIGETAPAGRNSNRIRPVEFLRGVFCLSKRYQRRNGCEKLNVAGYSTHPYSSRLGPFFQPADPEDVTIGVMGRLTKALDKAARTGAVDKNLPVYITEFGQETCPDQYRGVPLAQQAEYLGVSERMAYTNPRVKWYAQYLLNDGSENNADFQTGLRFSNGKPKPSLNGFRLPLAVLKRNGRVSIWGRVRPAVGQQDVTLLIADKNDSSFRVLRQVRTDERGVFTVTDADRDGRRWQLQWVDPSGTTTYRGAEIRAYGKTLATDALTPCK